MRRRLLVLCLLSLPGCSRRVAPATPKANFDRYDQDVMLVDVPQRVWGSWAAQCSDWEPSHGGYAGGRPCDIHDFVLAARCDRSCTVTAGPKPTSAFVTPHELGPLKVTATLTGGASPSIELARMVVPPRAFVLKGCLDADAVYATGAPVVCHVPSGLVVTIGVVGSTTPLDGVPDAFLSAATLAWRDARPHVSPETHVGYDQLVAYQGPLVETFYQLAYTVNDARVEDRLTEASLAAAVHRPAPLGAADYPVTLGFGELRAPVTFVVGAP